MAEFSAIIQNIQDTLTAGCGSQGLTGLFMAGVMALWYGANKEKREMKIMLIYAMACVFLVAMPLPVPDNFSYLLPMVPVLILVMLEAGNYIRKMSRQLIFAFCGMVLLFLAGTAPFDPHGWEISENAYAIPDEMLIVFRYVEQYQKEHELEQVLLWGTRDITGKARAYSGDFRLLYDRGLWDGAPEEMFTIPYESWAYAAAELIENPKDNEMLLAETGERYGCDILILSRENFSGEGAMWPVVIGDYRLYAVSDAYLVYGGRQL